jgi:hypothetical protein
VANSMRAAAFAWRKKGVNEYYSYQRCECVQVWYLEVCLHNHCEVGVVCLRHVLLVLAQLDCHNVAQVRTRVIPAQQQTPCQTLIRIRDILRRDPNPDPWIRTLNYRSEYGSCSFRQWLSSANKNKFFCLLLTVGAFTSDVKDNKSLRSHKTVEIKVFLNFFAC